MSDQPPSVQDLDAPPAPEQPGGRCPATTRHVTAYTVLAVGVQCKYTRGHDGDHAGWAGPGEGDVFWPDT